MNTKTGVKDTEVESTREKENGSDKGQTKIDSEAAKPKAPKLSGFPMSISWFPGDMATMTGLYFKKHHINISYTKYTQ